MYSDLRPSTVFAFYGFVVLQCAEEQSSVAKVDNGERFDGKVGLRSCGIADDAGENAC